MPNKCEVCNKEFKEQYFNTEQNKCILHSSKDKDSPINNDDFSLILTNLIHENLENELTLSDINFPKEFNYQLILNLSNNITFWYCTFNEQCFDTELDLNSCKKIHFMSCIFNEQWIHFNIHDICYSECKFNNNLFFHRDCSNQANKIHTICIQKSDIYHKFDLDFSAENIEPCEISMLDFSDTIFHKKLEIKDCIISNINFINTKFKGLADFYKTIFTDKTFFHKTTFEDIVVFTESRFKESVDFQYTTFAKLALFRKTIFEKSVNFIDSIFSEEANFLDMEADVKNRETARIIKHSFEQQDNIIEANRFYTLEMEEQEKELTWKNNFSEKIIFVFHKLSSNHSQSWILTLFWIINITLGVTFLQFEIIMEQNLLYSISIIYITITLILIGGLAILEISKKYKLLFALIFTTIYYFIYAVSSNDFNLCFVANNLNPFSIMTGKETLTIGILFYKITMAYLIYQLILSIRQNTRRK